MSAVKLPLKFHLITYGCQMNKNDSERIESLLLSAGLSPALNYEDSDLILLNTCSIRQTAEDRVFGQLRNFAKLKSKKPGLILGVTGCMPGRDKMGMIRNKLPMVDLFFPISQITNLPRWISELNPEFTNSQELEEDYLKINPHFVPKKQAFVTISSGCNNFCTFCVVPFSRGREKSRAFRDIMEEIHHLRENGAVEITLLGQNVNTYRPLDIEHFSSQNPFKDPFAALLWEINQIPEIKRIHFTAPNPQDMSDEVILALGLPNHINYLHLPVQAGSEKVLRKMNRRYTLERYLEIIEKVKKIRPTIALGTDIIVGFPGETEEDFMETIELYKKVAFDISYTAMYSARSGTAAFTAFKDDVPHSEKKRRWNFMQDMMEETTLRKNQKYVGQTVEVLVDKYEDGLCEGNSREFKRVLFPSDQSLTGQIINVEIELALTWILQGKTE